MTLFSAILPIFLLKECYILSIISLPGCALIDAPSSDHPEYRKICLITKVYYAFIPVNALVDSTWMNLFYKKNLSGYYQLMHSRATTC